MFSRISVLVLTVLMLNVPVSFAQMPDLGKFGMSQTSSAPSPIITNLMSAKDQLTGSYAQSSQTMASGLGQMLSSLGAGNNDILSKLSVAKTMNSGNINSSSTSLLHQAVDKAGQMLKEKFMGTQNLTPDSQKSLESGLSSFVGGLSNFKGMLPQIGTVTQQAKSAITTAPLQDKVKAQSILTQLLPLAQNAAQDFNSYKGILSSVLQYAASHNIKVPAMAQSLLQ